MTSKKYGETLPDNVSQPGPSQKTDSHDKRKRDEEGRKENRDQKGANDSNYNKTEKAVRKKKMTYRVLEVQDPMTAQIECLEILKSLGAEIPPNAADYINLGETRKIFVIEAENSSRNESENRSTHDTDQELNIRTKRKYEDEVKKPKNSNKD